MPMPPAPSTWSTRYRPAMVVPAITTASAYDAGPDRAPRRPRRCGAGTAMRVSDATIARSPLFVSFGLRPRPAQPAEEFPRDLGARLVHDLRRRSILGDRALVDHPDARRDVVGELHLMGDHQHRHAAPGEAADDVVHVVARLGIERAG